MSLIRSKFIGGVLDGRELEVEEEFLLLNVPIKDGIWVGGDVLEQWQVYEKKGETMVYVETKMLW